MNLEHIDREDLEDIMCDMLKDIKLSDSHLYQKYYDIIDEIENEISEEDAVHIVKSFKPYGEVYSMSRIEDILNKLGVSDDYCVDYYLTMNMFYNDFKPYVDSKRLDVQDFCIEMSKLFINDEDAPKNKIPIYFKAFLKDDNI